MSGNDAIIGIGAQDNGLAATVARSVADLDRLNREMDRVSTTTRKASAGTAALGLETKAVGAISEKTATQIQLIEKAAQILPGPLGSAAGQLAAFREGASKASVSMIAMTGATVAGVAIVASFAAAALNAAANAKEMVAQTDAAGFSLGTDLRNGALEADAALQGVTDAGTAMALTLAGELSPAIILAAEGLTGLIVGATDLVVAFDEATRGIRDMSSAGLDWISWYFPALGGLRKGAEALADYGREAMDAARAQREMTAAREAERAMMMSLGMFAESTPAAGAAPAARGGGSRSSGGGGGASADPRGGVNAAAGGAVGALDFSGFDLSTAEETGRALIESVTETTEEIGDILNASNERIAQSTEISNQRKKMSDDDYFQNLHNQAERWAGDFQMFSGIILGTANNLNDALSKSSKKHAKRQFAIMKAAAIVQATIDTLLAVTKTMAQIGGIPGIILGAVVGAIGAVNIGLIAAKQPPAHRGAMLAPDEVDFGGRRVRSNERLGAVLTDQGRAAAERQVNRYNAGTPEGGGGNIYLLVNDRQFGTRQVAGADPSFGRRARSR